MAENRRLQGRAPHAGGRRAPADACPPWSHAVAAGHGADSQAVGRTGRPAMQEGPFGTAKRAVSQRQTGHAAGPAYRPTLNQSMSTKPLRPEPLGSAAKKSIFEPIHRPLPMAYSLPALCQCLPSVL